MKINPGTDKLLVRKINVENKTQTGIYLPGTSNDDDAKVDLFKIIACGPMGCYENGTPKTQVFFTGDYIIMPSVAPKFPLRHSPLLMVRGISEQNADFLMVRNVDALAKVELEGDETWPEEADEFAGAAHA